MSYFDDASLVMIPSGYKDQKVYSVKPIDGSGDLTFSRASNATRVNSSGLVEKVRTNEVKYSEDQTNWIIQVGTSVTANTAANPLNGAITADKVIPDTILQDHYRGRAITNSMVGEVTASIYLKADGYTIFDFGIFDSTAGNYPVRAVFDLSTESITYITGSVASITSVGSGWYRVSITGSLSTSSILGIYHRVRSSGTSGVYSGDGTSGMLLWGCQLESGVMTDYVGPTTTTAVSVGPVSGLPRLDYSGGASCPSLLLEPQRSNVVLFSESIDNAAWTKDGSTCTANQTTSPSGYVDADLITNNGGAADHSVYQQYALSASTAYSVSAYVKKGTEQYVFFALNYGANSNEWATATFNLDAGTSGNYSSVLSAPTSTITSVGNDWYRVTMTATTATSGTHILIIGFGKAGAPDTSRGRYIANNTNTFYLWGAQFEAGAYATSYIPTLSSAVTRVADAASKTGISSLIGQTEGTLYWEVDFGVNASSEYPALFLWDGTSTNRMLIQRRGNTSKLQYQVVVAGSVQVDELGTTTIGVGKVKIAVAYKANDFVVYLNGVQEIVDTSGTTYSGALSQLAFQNTRHDQTSAVLLFKTRLSNADLATLTTL